MAAPIEEPEQRLDQEPAPHLSHSRVNRYLLCPEQYRLYYVENLRPKAPSASLVFGQLIHQALAGLLLRQADPVRYFRETWAVLKGVYLSYSQKESWDKLNVCGEGLLKKFVAEELQKLKNIRSVEKPFEIGFTGHDLPLVGVIDLEA